MKPYLFAAQWADGSYEVTVSQNGEAERRYMLARGLGGPVRLSHGIVTSKHTDEAVRQCLGQRFGVPASELKIEYIGDCPRLRTGKPQRTLFTMGGQR